MSAGAPDAPAGASEPPEEAPGPWRPPALDGLVPIPTYGEAPVTPASDLQGVDLAGRPVEIDLLASGGWTLVLFLSARCDGCLTIWEALADPVGSGLVSDEVVVVVTRDSAVDDPQELSRLAPSAATVVMSSQAWAAYRVQGPPFFALVDGRPEAASTVATEGVAWAVPQIAADVARARARS